MRKQIKRVIGFISALLILASNSQYVQRSFTGGELPAVTAEEIENFFTAQQMVIDGTVGIRLFFVNDYDLLSFEIDGNACEIMTNGNGDYIQLNSSAKNFADMHEVVVRNGGEIIYSCNNISIKQCAEDYLNATSLVTAEQKDFVRALNNYCCSAQIYFGEGTEFTSVTGYLTEDESDVLFKESAKTINNQSTAFDYYGTSLLLRDNTVLRHYFTLKDGQNADNATIFFNNQEFSLKQKDSLFYFEIENISPLNYDTEYSVKLRKNGTSCSVECSVRDYITQVHNKYKNSEVSAELNNVATALNNLSYYTLKMEEYFSKQITGAYMINDTVYVRGTELPETLTLNVLLRPEDIDGCGAAGAALASDSVEPYTLDNGPVKKDDELNLTKSGEADSFGFVPYINSGAEVATLSQGGEFKLCCESEEYPVVSIMNYRVDSGKEITDGTGNHIPFSDFVYPIIYNNDEYSDISVDICATAKSLDSTNWPKLLADGNNDLDAGEVAYPKEDNSSEPNVYRDTQAALSELSAVEESATDDAKAGRYSLDQYDRLTVNVDGDTAMTFYWDQISKIWYADKTNESSVNMVYINGGNTYNQGEFRDGTKVSGVTMPYYSFAYMFDNEGKEVDMKQLWRSIYDPEFMSHGTTVPSGANAIVPNEGAEGLYKKNSTANNQTDDLWKTNGDSVDAHSVQVDDFMLGEYEITMNQYYKFVYAVSADGTSYEIGGQTYALNNVAAQMIKDKKSTAGVIKDNGWGKGSRPAIDVCWYEAVEYCNYLSRIEGLEPCYSFTDIYGGAEGSGTTTLPYLTSINGSVMQKGKYTENSMDVQLQRITCDFSKTGYRLPTEAEYEYAARGGENINEAEDKPGYLYSGSSSLSRNSSENCKYIWSRKNVENPQKSGSASGGLYTSNMGGNGYSCPVGSLLPNNLGLYDMCGNVWEACWDFYNQSYYTELKNAGETVNNPTGPAYSDEQLSVLNGFAVDSTMEGKYKYTYTNSGTIEDDGKTYTQYDRTAYTDVSFAGKLSHTYRGGCFTSQGYLMETTNRFGPSQTYTDNCINFTDARIGFRVARKATESDAANADKQSAEESIKSIFRMLGSNKDYDERTAALFTEEARASDTAVCGDKAISEWLDTIDRTAYNYYELTDIDCSLYTDALSGNIYYEYDVFARYYDNDSKFSQDADDMKYTFIIKKVNDEMKIASLEFSAT